MKIVANEQGVSFTEISKIELETLRNSLLLFLRETDNDEAQSLFKILEDFDKQLSNPKQLSLFLNANKEKEVSLEKR